MKILFSYFNVKGKTLKNIFASLIFQMIQKLNSDNKPKENNKLQISYSQTILTFITGFMTGTAAGLIGVGGGEFRMPYLMWLFKKEAKSAAAVNLIVGSFTVIYAFVKRWKSFSEIQTDFWILGGIFALASLAGSYFGVRKVRLISNRIISVFVLIYLIAVGVWMLYESFSHTETIEFALNDVVKYILAGATGFLIAAISVGLGVAGGEMRIPLLMYVFALPVKIAGTISLFASIPTVITGAVTYKNYGYLPKQSVIVAVIMSAGSLAGIMMGVYLLDFTNKYLLTGLLGGILLLASGMIFLSVFKNKH